MYEKLSIRSSFSGELSLRNIMNGIAAKNDVNVNECEFVEKNAVRSMIG